VSSDQSGLLKPANRMVNLGVQGNELKTRGYRPRIVPTSTSSQALLPLDEGTNDSVKLPLREIGNFHLRAIICLTLLVRNS